MHKNGYTHRDIKPENFLINDATTNIDSPGGGQDSSIVGKIIKLADFGLAKDLSETPGNLTEYVSTRWYRAPELLLHSSSYGTTVDLFALGCIMGELYLGRPLFPGNSESDQLYKVFSILGTPS